MGLTSLRRNYPQGCCRESKPKPSLRDPWYLVRMLLKTGVVLGDFIKGLFLWDSLNVTCCACTCKLPRSMSSLISDEVTRVTVMCSASGELSYEAAHASQSGHVRVSIRGTWILTTSWLVLLKVTK